MTQEFMNDFIYHWSSQSLVETLKPLAELLGSERPSLSNTRVTGHNSSKLFHTGYKSVTQYYFIIIIFVDIFPPSRRGSHAKSDYARTITHHTPLSPYTRLLCLYFSSCALFTVYPNSIMKRHPTPLAPRAREGGPKEHRNHAKMAA